ncbi:ABC transporter substrate-binding protein [Paracoccus sp. (in: a-proteobacteria)]|uniref:ABC transporter substrate-binding protein n=1 Tax=Paracoccus sp. TaxID=267 RepID=UPI003A868FB4
MNRSAITAGILALTLATPGLADDPIPGGVLRILATGEPDHLDPTTAGMVNTNNFMRAVSRQLVSYEASDDPAIALKPAGDLATEVPAPTDDGLTYTFTLRQGATWDAPSGARQITSEDVERGIKRMCNPVLPTFTLSYYTNLIDGLAEFCDGLAGVEPTAGAIKTYIEGNDVPGVDTPDPETVVFHLKEKAGDFIYMLSLANSAAAPVEILDYLPDSPEYRANFIASGPYTIGEYVPDTLIRLVRNPSWNADSDPLRSAYVDEIEMVLGMQADGIMQQLQSGDADLAYDINIPPAILAMLTTTGDEKLVSMSAGNTNFLVINTVSDNNGGALKDLRVRQALNYAVDKAAIVQQWGGPTVAEPVNGIFGIGVLGYHPFSLYPTPEDKGDPDKAKALLAEAGFPDGLTLKMPYRNKDLEVATAQTLQASLARAGIKLELTPVTAADYYSKFMTNPANTRDGIWDIAPVGWTPDWVGGAARSVFQPQFTFDGTHQTYNYTDYDNPAANEIAAQAINAASSDETAALWGQVDEMVMADAPVVPLIANKNPRYHGEAVQNYLPYALGVEGDWTNIWVDR